MIKKNNIKILSLIITTTIIISSVSACGNQKEINTGDIKEETSNTQLYELDMNSSDEVQDIEENNMVVADSPIVEAARKAEEEAKEIEADAKKAEEAAKRAEELAKKMEEKAKAEEDRLKAEAEAKKAEEERIKAEEETKKAEAEAKKAEEERLKAEAEAKIAEEARLLAENAENDELTPTQLMSINMLNYMTVLTQKINKSKGNQMFLESARTSLQNDTVIKAVDTKTQAQIKQLVGTIDDYRMIDVKRDRLEFIYEQNKAQALRTAIPGPMAVLNVVQSGNFLKAAVSVVYMAVDAASSYEKASNQAELQFIKVGWELDDADTKILQDSTIAQFDYMCNMVRDYDLPDEYVVRDTDVEAFVGWTNKTNLVAKIDWLKANEQTYQKFGPYWLELVKDYYDAEDYKNCIYAINQYEAITARIVRKDLDYANVLPMVIMSARATMPKSEYVKTARNYCEKILKNTKDENWALRYFVAQIYLDLYAQTNDEADLKNVYDIAYYNVNILIDEQKKLNTLYIQPVVEVKADKNSTKRERKEIKQYNKLCKDERKIALPPVSEALYLNCDLLFAAADKLNISANDRRRMEELIHENGEDLFLSKSIDNRFRMNPENDILDMDGNILFDGESITVPACFLTNRSQVEVTINGTKAVLDDWNVVEVERPKESSYIDFVATLTSKKGKSYKYNPGDKIMVNIIPVLDSPEQKVTLNYEVVASKKAFVFNGVTFERK